MTIAALEALCSPSEKLCLIKIKSLASCLSGGTKEKGISQNCQLMARKLSSHSLRFSKLTVLLWMMAFVCSSHHLLILIFLRSETKQNTGIISVQLRKFRIISTEWQKQLDGLLMKLIT